MTTPAPYRPTFDPSRELRRMEMTFTEPTLKTVASFRVKMRHELGRRVSVAEAIDILIKSHPFVAGNRSPLE